MKESGSQNLRLRLLSYVVICYMLLAFGWWIVLLITKNDDAFQAKSQLLKIGLVAEEKIQSEEDFLKYPAYLALSQEYQKQKWMILGEALVLTISLCLGFWLINRGYNKEVMAAKQRRNFLLSITHELKSPIASIRLVLETILKRTLSIDQTQKLGSNALKETDRLNKLVNDLLLSARLESTYELHRTEIDLQLLLKELVDQMRTKHPQATFNLHVGEEELFFYGDHTGVSSVVLNVLENGVKYSLPPAHIDVTCESDDAGIFLKVKDQGLGIDEKEKKNIFDKFYRVGNEDTRKTKGTGLGLFIVNEIVKAHNGSVEVEDNQPNGTIFKIYFPHANNVV